MPNAAAPIRARPAVCDALPSKSIRPAGFASTMPADFNASAPSTTWPFHRSSALPIQTSMSALGLAAPVAPLLHPRAVACAGPTKCGRSFLIATSSNAVIPASLHPANAARGMAAARRPSKPDLRLPLPSICMPTTPASVSSRMRASRSARTMSGRLNGAFDAGSRNLSSSPSRSTPSR